MEGWRLLGGGVRNHWHCKYGLVSIGHERGESVLHINIDDINDLEIVYEKSCLDTLKIFLFELDRFNPGLLFQIDFDKVFVLSDQDIIEI